ncbi:MAG: S8 family serine peptidase, partial [Phycisphaerae bacterium]
MAGPRSGAVGLAFLPLLLVSVSFARGPGSNDEFFALQWSLQNTGQEVHGDVGLPGADVSAVDAWSIHSGTSPVVVAIVGTGVGPHPELGDRLLPGYATVGDPFDTLDPCHKGTHSAGIIAAARGNGIGIAGLNDHVLLLPVRAFTDCASGGASSVAMGIRWAVDQGADIILAAVALIAGDQRLAEAVDYAAANDVLVIAPAGDDGAEDVAFPARYPACLAVSATTKHDTLAAFSNFGNEIDVSAPGEDILSTGAGVGFSYRSSTVSAAAVATGVAALVMSYAPGIGGTAVGKILIDSVDDLGDPRWDRYFGAGRISAWRALTMTLEPPIRFEYLEPLPSKIPPGVTTTFAVRVADAAETVVPRSVHLAYRTSTGLFMETPSVLSGGSLYRFRLPALPCDVQVQYYLSAAVESGSALRDPLNAPDTTHSALAVRDAPVFDDGFELERGWVAVAYGGENTTGRWERVDPNGTFASAGVPAQPEFDYSPDSGRLCFVTGQHRGGHAGVNDVDEGPVVLTSPVIPLDAPDAEVSYARWFHSSGGVPDELTVEFSRDGGYTWRVIETVTATDGWEVHRVRLSDFPGMAGDQLQVRFSTQDPNCAPPDQPCSSLTEAAIDEFHVRAILCSSSLGDYDGNGRITLTDYLQMYRCFT